MSEQPTKAEALAVLAAIPTWSWKEGGVGAGSARPRRLSVDLNLSRAKVDAVLRALRERGCVYSDGGHYQMPSETDRELARRTLEVLFG